MLAPALLLPRLVTIADAAAAVVMRHYAAEISVEAKADASPVTAADAAAEAVILEALRELTPAIPVVAEEEVSAGRVPHVGAEPFWLVDPLDGTREFISRNGEFTVNVALIEGGLPIAGVVAAPAKGWLWCGAVGHGASRRDGAGISDIKVRPRPGAGAVAVASRSHRDTQTDSWLKEQGITDTVSAGSSLKFCLIAEGKADVYPRFGPTMEWDTAAGHAVLHAAGGQVVTTGGEPLHYGKPGFRNPGFIARGA